MDYYIDFDIVSIESKVEYLLRDVECLLEDFDIYEENMTNKEF